MSPEPLLPSYDGACITNVVPALLHPAERAPVWLPAVAHEAERVVLLVIDGLGWNQVHERRALVPVLAGLDGGPITTVAPSTTATALTSITTGLPQPYLEQILLALKGAGIVRSKRGVGGGYVLAREPSRITLGEIVSAVDGPISVGDFGEPHQDGACDHEGQCVLLAVWGGLSRTMRGHLDSFTLADIASMARGQRDWPTADELQSAAP